MSAPNLAARMTRITSSAIFLVDERVFVNRGIPKGAETLDQRGVAVEHLDRRRREGPQSR
jgi:hypothetical protein